jgi:hypothetical protein
MLSLEYDPTYLVFLTGNMWYVHVVGGGADILVFLTSKDVNTNKVNLIQK